ncbi:winged helix domain-containing protein [Microvirga yunnanensis]|uniref:winged helix domain-containing protein n=2 Tax=Microvirga TaxID=186650 RepID=UPI00358DCAC5
MSNDVVELLVQRLDTGEMLRLRGREAWTLACLMEVRERGVIPVEQPAPRWSAYVHSLRKRGLVIDTIDEPHAGPYSGTHGRYILHTPLRALKTVSAEEKRCAA